MLLSIIVPIYNSPEYLIPCLDKIELLTSHLKDQVEVILVNDGSKVPEIALLLRTFESKPSYRVITKTNGGVSSARNAGLKMATGKYIYFCDSDDEIIVDEFMRSMRFLLKEDIDVLVCNFLNQSSDLKRTKSYYQKGSPKSVTGSGFLYHSLRRDRFGAEVYQFFFKRSLIGNDSFIEGIIHEDDEFIPRVLTRARVVQLNPVDIYFRKFRGGSYTRDDKFKPRRNVYDKLRVIKSYKESPLNIHPNMATILHSLEIRSWLSIMDYMKTFPEKDKYEIKQKMPSPSAILFNSKALFNYRLKYIKRALFF